MFHRALISDVFRLAPEHFKDKMVNSVKDEINRVYSGRVVKDLGLCISFDQFSKLGDLKTVPGDGGAYVEAEFYLIVFNPVPGTLIRGRVTNLSEAGVVLSTDFFSEYFIPFHNIPQPAKLTKDHISVAYEDQTLSIGFFDEVIFRVQSVDYVDKLSEKPVPRSQKDDELSPVARLSKSPMIIIGTLLGEGLGPVQWWIDEEAMKICIEEAEILAEEASSKVQDQITQDIASLDVKE